MMFICPSTFLMFHCSLDFYIYMQDTSYIGSDENAFAFVLQTVAESGIADQMRLTELILSDVSFI